MKIVGTYSFNGGAESIQKDYSIELEEITQILSRINAQDHKTKGVEEKAKSDKVLYNPRNIGRSINDEFARLGWKTQEIFNDFPPLKPKRAPTKIDFTKNHLGVDVEFNKKPLPIYSGCAKMTIFHNMGFIDVGIEIVPVKELAEDMSSGVSYFEQFVWDLQQRGVSDIDIPVLILGVAP